MSRTALVVLPSRILGALLLRALHLYRIAVSPAIGQVCRFEPSCSAYAEEAVRRFGPWRGAWLAVRRVVRCHPFSAGGSDPVPRRS